MTTLKEIYYAMCRFSVELISRLGIVRFKEASDESILKFCPATWIQNHVANNPRVTHDMSHFVLACTTRLSSSPPPAKFFYQLFGDLFPFSLPSPLLFPLQLIFLSRALDFLPREPFGLLPPGIFLPVGPASRHFGRTNYCFPSYFAPAMHRRDSRDAAAAACSCAAVIFDQRRTTRAR